MNNISYSRPLQISGALSDLTGNDSACCIAGGTNLLDLMKENVARPSHLIDINRLALSQIESLPDGGLRLGALATNADTAYHPEVQKRYPLLSKTILAGATPQLRNMATNGGNLMQRTRCYYFYDTATPCNKRQPGTGCGAINGYNRIHAVLGASDQCIATHPSDMCVALAVLEAKVIVRGPGGERAIAFEDFHRLPGQTPQVDNTLKRDELIVAIDLPSGRFVEHHAYLKLRDRASYAFAIVSVAVGLEMDGQTIKEARLALGGVAHKPWRDQNAEAMLEDQTPSPEIFAKAAEQIFGAAKGYEHNNFKIELGKRAVIRALSQAVTMESEHDSNVHRTTTEPR